MLGILSQSITIYVIIHTCHLILHYIYSYHIHPYLIVLHYLLTPAFIFITTAMQSIPLLAFKFSHCFHIFPYVKPINWLLQIFRLSLHCMLLCSVFIHVCILSSFVLIYVCMKLRIFLYMLWLVVICSKASHLPSLHSDVNFIYCTIMEFRRKWARMAIYFWKSVFIFFNQKVTLYIPFLALLEKCW
jgi:hypothetical protein